MAIDTAAKQSSMLNMVCGLSFNLLPIPDGAYDDGDKQHLLGLYRGIAFFLIVRATSYYPHLTTARRQRT